MECFRLLFDHLAWIEYQFLIGIRDSRKAGSLWGMLRCGRSKEVNTPELIGQRLRVTMLRFYGSSGRDSVRRDQYSSNRVSGISSRTMYQSTLTFGYSLSLEAVIMRQLRRWKRLWRSLTRSHKRISMGPFRSCWNGTSALQPGAYFLRGLEFYVCAINKSAHTKKSGNLFNDPRR